MPVTLLLQNELCRIRLDDPMFDELVHEYCVYRGFVNFSVVDSPGNFLSNFTFHSYILFANMYLKACFFIFFPLPRDAT